jgi:hypothetical protein
VTTKYPLLLTAVLLLSAICGLKAQEVAYDHKIIAILPFRTTSHQAAPRGNDSTMQRLIAEEETQGIEAQAAFYDAVTADEDRLLVDVQPWQLTDSLLKQAGVDFRKINYMDKQVLAKLLKVDAVLTGQMNKVLKASPYLPMVGGLAGAEAAAAMHANEKKKLFAVFLYDGKTGDAIWNFEREVDGSYNKDKKQNAKLFKAFIKQFPYTR